MAEKDVEELSSMENEEPKPIQKLKFHSRTKKPTEFVSNVLSTGNWFGQEALLHQVGCCFVCFVLILISLSRSVRVLG